MRFRITYKNSWNELKTIIIESDSYYEVLRQVGIMFGSDKIVSVEDLDKPATSDYNLHENDITDPYGYDWLSD